MDEPKPISAEDIIVEVDIDLVGELATAQTPEEQSLAKSGFGVEGAGGIGIVYADPLSDRDIFLQLVALYYGRPNYQQYGFGLRVTNSSLTREPGSIFMPREGPGNASPWKGSSLLRTNERNLVESTFFLQGIRNDHSTINIPDQNLFFGGWAGAKVGGLVLVGFDYRGSDTTYNADFLGEEIEIALQWYRVMFHSGFVVPLGNDHGVNFGYKGGLEVRGLMGRLPHGPFADYEGEVGPVRLGLGAHALFMTNLLNQDYEIVWDIEPRVVFPENNLEFGAWFGNRNPYDRENRAGFSVTWRPPVVEDLADASIGDEVEYINTDNGIVRDTVVAGFHLDNRDEEVEEVEPATPTEPEVKPTKDPSLHLYGGLHFSAAIGAMWTRFPFGRRPSTYYQRNFSISNITGVEDLEIDTVENVENLTNIYNAEQGPVVFTGADPDVILFSLMASGNIYTNRQRNFQFFWEGGLTPLIVDQVGYVSSGLDAGLGLAWPKPLGKGWAVPLRASGGGGLEFQYGIDLYANARGRDFTEWDWYVQGDLLEKVWEREKRKTSLGLFVRGGQAVLSNPGVVNYVVAGIKLGEGARNQPRPVRLPPPPPPVEEKLVVVNGPWIVEADVREVGRIENQLNGPLIRFQENQPMPVDDGEGFDSVIRDVKEAALDPTRRYNPDNESEAIQFLADFKPQQFLMNPVDALLVVELAKLTKEVLAENPDKKIIIFGYTNSRGDEEVNQKLSDNRAHLMRSYLVLLGIDQSRLQVVPKGESDPLFSEENMPDEFKEAAFAVNRRVIFRLASR